MFYVSGFLIFLALYFGYSAYRSGGAPAKALAFCFLVAGLGTMLITWFAFGVFDV